MDILNAYRGNVRFALDDSRLIRLWNVNINLLGDIMTFEEIVDVIIRDIEGTNVDAVFEVRNSIDKVKTVFKILLRHSITEFIGDEYTSSDSSSSDNESMLSCTTHLNSDSDTNSNTSAFSTCSTCSECSCSANSDHSCGTCSSGEDSCGYNEYNIWVIRKVRIPKSQSRVQHFK